MSLSQQDLDVRLQLTNCCIGTLTSELLTKIKIGSKDINCKLQDLEVIEAMLEYLQCYNVITEDIMASGQLAITATDASSSIQIFVNGFPISSIYNTTSSNINVQMNNLANIINSFQDNYNASFDLSNHVINITSSTCTNYKLTIVTTGKLSTIVSGLNNGVCSNNCLTEAQVIAMFDWISTKCKTCFQIPGFKYSN